MSHSDEGLSAIHTTRHSSESYTEFMVRLELDPRSWYTDQEIVDDPVMKIELAVAVEWELAMREDRPRRDIVKLINDHLKAQHAGVE